MIDVFQTYSSVVVAVEKGNTPTHKSESPLSAKTSGRTMTVLEKSFVPFGHFSGVGKYIELQ